MLATMVWSITRKHSGLTAELGDVIAEFMEEGYPSIELLDGQFILTVRRLDGTVRSECWEKLKTLGSNR